MRNFSKSYQFHSYHQMRSIWAKYLKQVNKSSKVFGRFVDLFHVFRQNRPRISGGHSGITSRTIIASWINEVAIVPWWPCVSGPVVTCALLVYPRFRPCWNYSHSGWQRLKWLLASTESRNVYGHQLTLYNTNSPRENGGHFADDTFQWIFLNENYCI